MPVVCCQGDDSKIKSEFNDGKKIIDIHIMLPLASQVCCINLDTGRSKKKGRKVFQVKIRRGPPEMHYKAYQETEDDYIDIRLQETH